MTTTNKMTKYILLTTLGLILIVSGAIIAKITRDADGILLSLPYVMIGIGSGIFGQNLGMIINIINMKKYPEEARKKEIEVNDERNIAIRDKAKAKAYDLMVLVFGALMLSYAMTNSNLYVILSFVIAYLFVTLSNIYFINKLQKEI
ncbi:hypothetical protein [Anaeromicropila herbilytica]|uniref:DUF2178 domain-containing protein n=1 Tax=Anaeromicropila herbilytica TaxID=2785025 RepID=A0A7R7ICT3_9FIRM|nr:hypothetical protein [Anaeromicropila herbilytica]BCN30201.1 hypothetical protein bsdtb5_14960 [Anaeromicropila herbilytica]